MRPNARTDAARRVGVGALVGALVLAVGLPGARTTTGVRVAGEATRLGEGMGVAFASTPPLEVRSPAPAAPAKPPPPRSVVLVTIDGVRWEDVFHGASAKLLPEGSRLAGVEASARPFSTMPRTKRLVQRGVALGGGGDGCGTVKPAGGAFVSLPGYLEILRGRRTACDSNACVVERVPSVLDAAALAGHGPVASISSWPKIARAASAGGAPVLVSAGRRPWPVIPVSDPSLARLLLFAEKARPSPGRGLYRPDEHTARIALAYLRAERPRLLHVGFGDTDEHGHRADYALYLDALRDADAFIDEVVTTADDLGMRTTVLVTTDHGRSVTLHNHGRMFPESGRSFLLAFGDGVPARGMVCQHRDVTLPDVGATVRTLLDMEADASKAAGAPITEVLGS
jgi:hypothetical protein